MSFSNAQLAQKISDLIDYWSSFSVEYADWLGGTVSGGPNSDGEYPLTDYTGTETLVKSPAKLQDDVDNITTGATAQANAAAASAAAALTSENNAATSEATALSHANDADADRVAAAISETNATNAAVTSTTQANLATDRAGYAQEWAITVEDTLVSVAAGGNGTTDYSSLHHAAKSAASASAASTSETNAAASAAAAAASAIEAATFDPALFAALADNETITGLYKFTNASGFLVESVTPQFHFRDTNATVDEKNWIIRGDADQFRIQTASDAAPYSGVANLLSAARTGTAIGAVTAAGAWSFTGSVAVTGAVTGSNLNVSNWDTAYGWGNHASAGYALLTGNTFTGNHQFNDGFTIGDSAGRVLVNDTGDGGTRLYMAGRNAGNTDWDWANEFGYDQANSRWYVDGAFYINGRSVGATQIDNWNNAPILSTLTQADTYLYLNRNNASNPVLHVAQVGAGPIAKFGKVPSLGSTGYTAEIIFGNDGAITAEGLTVNDVTQTARLNIVGGTSGNTHFNWSSNGENYLTHKNTGFTRFRGYDGVSTYTTRAEMSDADFEVHILTKVNSQILAGNGYGSAGTPSFSSTQDANSGMYVSASDTLGFSTGGIERVKIDVNGLTMVASGADLILGNNSLTADNISSSAGAAPLKIGTGTGTPMVWGQYCALGRTYSAARTGLANNAYIDSDDAVSGQWRHLVTHASYGHTILEMAAGTYYFYGNGDSVTSGNIVSKNQIGQLDYVNGLKVTSSGNTNPGNDWSSLSRDMLHIDGKEAIDGNDTYLRLNQNLDYTSGVYTPGVFRVDGGLKLNADCTLSRQGSSQCRVTTAYGYTEIGPNNTSWAHFNTDRANFYFNKGAHFAGQPKYYNLGAIYYNGASTYASGKVTFSTSAATGGSSGDIWYQYT